MNRTAILVLIGLVAIAGCQHDFMEVTVEGGGQFPASLAGKWKAVDKDWEIYFEPDGKISYAIVPLGRTFLQPGRETVVPLVEEGKGVYRAGKWRVIYVPDRRELAAVIVIDHFRAQVGASVVRGHTEDYFVGPVTADGNAWFAGWVHSPQYIVDTEDVKNYELPTDPNNLLVAVDVVFEKVNE